MITGFLVSLALSLITQKPVKDLGFPREAIIGGIIRGANSFIAVGESQITANDKVVIFSLPDGVKKIERFFK